MAWTIELARKCPLIDTIAVSTDSLEIAAVSEACGVPVPFMRPVHLAEDATPSADVILHALDFYASSGRTFDYITMLQVTSPLRRQEDIERAFALLQSHSGAESIVSVGRVGHQHPAFQTYINEDGFMRPLGGLVDGVIPAIRRQDLETEHYFFDGNVYISTVGAFRRMKSFFHATTIPYIDDKLQTVDIDDEIDFSMAECLMKRFVLSAPGLQRPEE